jgi:hypothetical protein
VSFLAERKPFEEVLDERPEGTRMDTDFPRMNTDTDDRIRFVEGMDAIQFRVHPWEIRVHPCSSFAPRPEISPIMKSMDLMV